MAGTTSPSDERAALGRARRQVEGGIERGRELGAQVHILHRGEVVADWALGEARPGEPLRPDHLLLWMSAVKPAMGVAMLQLRERGLLDLDDPVCRFLPEFASSDKGEVTLRHVLTHTGGFRGADPKWSGVSPQEIVAEICAAPLDEGARAGAQAAYHVSGGWYVLAEVVRRVDGRPYERYVRECVFEPIGASDAWVGMPAEAHARYGGRVVPAWQGDGQALAPIGFWPFTGSALACGICRPGGSGWARARDLARLYATLAAGGAWHGARLLEPESVALLTQRHTEALVDAAFGVVLDRGLGVVLDSRHHDAGGNWYGSRVSRDTFGHAGFGCSVGFADPRSDVVVAAIFHGMLEHGAHEERMRSLVDALYEDLGLG